MPRAHHTQTTDLSVEGNSAQGNGLIIGGLAGYNSPESTIGGENEADACTNNGDVIVPLACQQGGLAGLQYRSHQALRQ